MRFTQKALKTLVASGAAVDVTNHGIEEYEAIKDKEGYLEEIGKSRGVYGMNGGLWKGHNTGTLYACTARSTAIFIYA